MKRYPKYKDSGVEWLGEVPEHWEALSIRRYLLEHRQGYYSPESYVDEGIKLLRITDLLEFGGVEFSDCPKVEDQEGLEPFLLRAGDFVFARTGGAGTFGLIPEVSESIAYASYLIRFRFSPQAQPSFLRYFFLSGNFQNAVRQNIHGGVNQNVHAEDIKNQFVSLPPATEQTAIAAFLDRETGKIDALVSEQRRLIELLKEKRQAVISHAVTKGLNPNAKLKPSGIEWLGDVPEHWEAMAIKKIVEVPITDGPHETPHFIDEGVPFVSAEAVSSGRIDFTKVRACISAEDNARYSEKYAPKLHDVYMVKSGATTGVSAIVEGRTDFNIWSPLAAIRCGPRVLPYFLLNFMRSRNFIDAITLNWSFGTQQNIGMRVIENLSITVPPIEEQTRIVELLGTATAKHDTLIAAAERAIELLQERRTALISAAVTGKIDVRESFVGVAG